MLNNIKNKFIEIIKEHTLLSSTIIVLSITLTGLMFFNTKSQGNKISDKKVYTQKKPIKENQSNENFIPEKNSAVAAEGSSCNINPSPECANLVFGDPSVEFSQLFLDIMYGAGRRFATPPAALIAYMAGIRSLGKFNYLFEKDFEEELAKSLDWGGHIRGCDELDPMEQGPYDWIWNWFDGTLNTTNAAGFTAADALNSLSDGRGDVASRCNFIDATFVAASHFSQADKNGCNASWGDLYDKLRSLSWGSVLEESYAEDDRYGNTGWVKPYFDACKSN